MVLVSGLFSATWGALTYVRSGGWLSHAVQSAVLMAGTSVTLFGVAALLVARSQRVRLWIATRRRAKPSWRLLLVVGAFWGVSQGAIDLAFTRSAGRALLVASIYLAMFVVFPPLLLRLFDRELNAAV